MEFEGGPKPLDSLAKVAYDQIVAADLEDRNFDDEEVIDELAGILFIKWQADNSEREIPPSQNKLYGALDQNEREKFRIVIKEAIRAFQEKKLAA